MNVSAVWEVALAVVGSLGGGAALVFALSNWLGKMWANRILEAHKAELNRLNDENRAQLQELGQQRHDATVRKRDVYSRFAANMRVLQSGGSAANELQNDQRAFLESYAQAYLWASEDVVTAIRELLLLLEKEAKLNAGELTLDADERANLKADAKLAFQKCMLQMRRDAGFPYAECEYRVVSFAEKTAALPQLSTFIYVDDSGKSSVTLAVPRDLPAANLNGTSVTALRLSPLESRTLAARLVELSGQIKH